MKVTKRLLLLCIGIVVACQFDKEDTAVQQRGLESIEIVAEEPMDSPEIERISNDLTQRTFSRIISRFSNRDATSFEGIWIEDKKLQKHGRDKNGRSSQEMS